MQRKFCLSVIFALPLLLTACAGSQTSVDKNAQHMAHQIARLHFDPNTRPLTADNIRLMVQFLSPFYKEGKKDRDAGLSLTQAQQKVNCFSQQQDAAGSGPFSLEAQKSFFLTHQYTADQPEKRRKILQDGAIATYWDGYNGKP
jgi:hypothetical protein